RDFHVTGVQTCALPISDHRIDRTVIAGNPRKIVIEQLLRADLARRNLPRLLNRRRKMYLRHECTPPPLDLRPDDRSSFKLKSSPAAPQRPQKNLRLRLRAKTR